MSQPNETETTNNDPTQAGENFPPVAVHVEPSLTENTISASASVSAPQPEQVVGPSDTTMQAQQAPTEPADRTVAAPHTEQAVTTPAEEQPSTTTTATTEPTSAPPQPAAVAPHPEHAKGASPTPPAPRLAMVNVPAQSKYTQVSHRESAVSRTIDRHR